MAALTLSLVEHHALLGASDGRLDDQTGVLGDLLGLNGDLLGELAGGRDDDGPDVVGLRALVTADPLAELGVACDDALDDGDEETEGFASTCLCLCDAVVCQPTMSIWNVGDGLHINAAESLVDGPLLDVRHSLDLHLLGDGADDVGVHETTGSELCKPRCRSFLSNRLLCLDFLRDLLPLCAAVEPGHGGIGNAGRRYPQHSRCACERSAEHIRGNSDPGDALRQCCRTSSERAEHDG